MSIVQIKTKSRCVGVSCKKTVRVADQEKRTLCRECWLKRAEIAALRGITMIHIAHSESPHEWYPVNHLQDFIDEYDIERLEVNT